MTPASRQLRPAIVCAIGATATGPSPTGTFYGDALWLALIGGGVAYLATTSKRVPLLAGVVAAVVVSQSWLAFLAAVGGLVAVSVASERVAKRSLTLRGMAGGLAVISLLTSVGDVPVALALVATLVVLLPAASGLRHAQPRIRRGAFAMGTLIAGGCMVASAGALIGMAQARASIDAGNDAFENGLVAARNGDVDAAQAQLQLAESLLGRGERTVSSWGRLGTVVPVVAQNLHAVRSVSGALEDAMGVAALGASLVESNDITVQTGRVDLDAVSALENPLRRLSRSLEVVVSEIDHSLDGPLVPLIEDGLDQLRPYAVRGARDAALGAQAAAVLPDLLGSNGVSRYLVLFTSSAEARGRFGFPGSFAEVEVRDGRIILLEHGATSELLFPIDTDPTAFELADPLLRPYLDLGPTRDFRSVTIPPDFGTVSEVAAELWRQSGRKGVDGVLRFDAASLAPLLDYTGPVAVPGRDEPLTSENVERYVLFDQYVEFGTEVESRRDALEAIAETTFQRLETANLPGPRLLVDRYAPLARQGHIHVHTFDRSAQEFIERIGLDGALPAPATDALLVTSVNSVGNKVDSFLRKEIRYSARITAEQLEATLTLELHNDAPPSGLPDYVIGSSTAFPVPPGTNISTVLVYTQSDVLRAEIGGAPVRVRSSTSGGWRVHRVRVETPAASSMRLEMVLSGRSPRERGLTLIPGGGAQPDRYEVSVDDGGISQEFEGLVVSPVAVPRG